MKRIALLGSTGSIGRQALDIVQRLPDRLSVVALAACSNAELLIQQAREHGVKWIGLASQQAAERARATIAAGEITVKEGVEGLCELVSRPEVDLVVVAVAGMIGLQPTLTALSHGKPVALSTKEALVSAGEIVVQESRRNNAPIIPIDSEHSAIFQCLQGEEKSNIERVILTASGGALRDWPIGRLSQVTVADALNHPNWSMGPKVTVDSATMMNKGLEIIEARWLFDLPYDRISVALHPQSIVHSIVEFKDGSMKAQMGMPDMRGPIQYALTHPDRPETRLPRLPLEKMSRLEFSEMDGLRYPAIDLAYEAARKGGTAPTALNAANEAAVDLFLRGEIGFHEIVPLARTVLSSRAVTEVTLDNVLAEDAASRKAAYELARRKEAPALA